MFSPYRTAPPRGPRWGATARNRTLTAPKRLYRRVRRFLAKVVPFCPEKFLGIGCGYCERNSTHWNPVDHPTRLSEIEAHIKQLQDMQAQVTLQNERLIELSAKMAMASSKRPPPRPPMKLPDPIKISE